MSKAKKPPLRGAVTKATKQAEATSIAEITVAGFKSISDEISIEIRPLTILAGANSSGKSSMMQPLLLLKQTLEASYDPGPLRMHGPHVKFTSAEQLLFRYSDGRSFDCFDVGMRLNNQEKFQTRFRKEHKTGFRIERFNTTFAGKELSIYPEMTQEEIVKTGITNGLDFSDKVPEGNGQGQWRIGRERCFLRPVWTVKEPEGTTVSHCARPGPVWEQIIPYVIHVPGLRGNPERDYPMTAVGPTFAGTFEVYTASIIHHWETEKEETALAQLQDSLRQLGLTGGVTAARLNDVQIELRVGRLPNVQPLRPEDWVNIVDVGFGVSQALPVVTALLVARPGQLVYVEQPEIHLHPRAQFALAQVLAAAANRGVRVVVETHSSILLLGVQALVAEGKLDFDKVKLHWFHRENGRTFVNSADLDEAGRFGDWPEDFDDVTLKAESRFLDAAEARLAQK